MTDAAGTARSRSSSSTGSLDLATRRAIPRRRRDRAVHRGTAARARRSSRTGTSTPRTARWRGPGSPSASDRRGRGTIVSVKALARTEGPGGSLRREELEGPADRDRRTARMARVGRALAGARAGRRRAARRARHDPPAPPQANRQRWRHARGAEPRRGRRVAGARVVDHFVELEAELVKGIGGAAGESGRGVRRRSAADARHPRASSRRRWRSARGERGGAPGRSGGRRIKVRQRRRSAVGRRGWT